MFRYVALAWNPTDASQLAAAQFLTERVCGRGANWVMVVQQPALRVFCSGIRPGASECYPLADRAGVVLGTVFPRIADSTEVPRKALFGTQETRTLVASRGRELVRSYWGRYVAFLCDPAGPRQWLIRSPCGEIDCLTSDFRGVHVYLSSMTDWPAPEQARFTINWCYVAAHLCGNLYETRQTGLKEVTRVIHGECIEMEQARITRHCYWHPVDAARSEVIETFPDACRILRNTAKTVVHAWAASYGSIVQLLSGGLDSSIVLGCLRDAPTRPTITSVNYRNAYDPSTDEREFARLAATRAGCALVELEQDLAFSFEGRLDVPRFESPVGNYYLLAPEKSTDTLARAYGAEGIFSGDGGDQLLFQNGARFACRDYVLKYGVRAAASTFALDAARLEGDTVWRVLFGRSARSPLTRITEQVSTHELVTCQIRQLVRENGLFIHPWLQRAGTLTPGKWWHVYLLSSTTANDLCDPLGRSNSPEQVAPLTSQPLVELCLRIPSYLFLRNGRDRAVARQAFAQDVPREILERRAKASTYDAVKVLLSRNIELVRGLLLNGALIRERMLDRPALELALSGEGSVRGHATDILRYMLCEAWLQAWSSAPTAGH